MSRQFIVTDSPCDGCETCGVLVTAASQDGDGEEHCLWWADEGDSVICADQCGYVGWIRVDSERAWVEWIPPEDVDPDDRDEAARLFTEFQKEKEK